MPNRSELAPSVAAIEPDSTDSRYAPKAPTSSGRRDTRMAACLVSTSTPIPVLPPIFSIDRSPSEPFPSDVPLAGVEAVSLANLRKNREAGAGDEITRGDQHVGNFVLVGAVVGRIR